eukprot:scaffold58753_cov51-Phaeocystis_antarctica.AAC.1
MIYRRGVALRGVLSAETPRPADSLAPGRWRGRGAARRAWVIDLRRLGCGCGRRLVTASCVIREAIQTSCLRSGLRVCVYVDTGSHK